MKKRETTMAFLAGVAVTGAFLVGMGASTVSAFNPGKAVTVITKDQAFYAIAEDGTMYKSGISEWSPRNGDDIKKIYDQTGRLHRNHMTLDMPSTGPVVQWSFWMKRYGSFEGDPLYFHDGNIVTRERAVELVEEQEEVIREYCRTW